MQNMFLKVTQGDLVVVLGGGIINLGYTNPRIKRKSNFLCMRLQEVSRAHSTPPFLKKRRWKERTQSLEKLHPQYVVGFVDGEGSFSVSIYRDETMKAKIYVKPEFEIELRADDKHILERIQETLECGIIYECNYERYGWYPHTKFKVTKLDDFTQKVIPFFEKYPLQAKKAEVFRYFKEIIEKKAKGEHLTTKGVREIEKLREKIRVLGKKHNTIGNR